MPGTPCTLFFFRFLLISDTDTKSLTAALEVGLQRMLCAAFQAA